jgi:hypothetical protein
MVCEATTGYKCNMETFNAEGKEKKQYFLSETNFGL